MTSGDLRPAGVALAAEVTAALESGDPARAADLAGDAASAFLAEQGEPSFDAPNMLRLGAHAHLLAGDHRSALDTLDRARPLAEPLPAGEPFDRLNVQLQRLRGEALLAAGDRPAARAELQAALERCLATLGGDDIDTAVIHNMLGIVGKFTGRFDDALTHYTRAGELFRAHGVGDDVLGVLHHNLGGLAHSRGDLETAERETRRALELHTAAAGPAHPDSAADRGQLGAILSELGRHEEAERELRRTAADFAARYGPDHGGKLHFFGGTNLPRTVDTPERWALDLANTAAGWVTRAPLPNARHHMGSAVLGGRIYAVGGQHGHDEVLVTQKSVHAYDPATNAWTAHADLPRAIAHISGATFAMDDRIIVIGGEPVHGTSRFRLGDGGVAFVCVARTAGCVTERA